ncbi:hydrolase [Paraliobacillus quinghaiensis]|uniref:Hydrolase n=1 Tax=Paraliobacillus quinghaiensis TaxID=470815 RepID=A0A917TEF4_9BACI|nr:FeoB-associated Cys-rich membrane protein [Paraliobacillus quinghaiensis]GGM19746.1 hydrolase [Paraliobacillus quinghaiensis]
MFVNYVIGVLIFSYAIWTLVRLIRRSKEGKCAACELKKSCAGDSCIIPTDDSSGYPKK